MITLHLPRWWWIKMAALLVGCGLLWYATNFLATLAVFIVVAFATMDFD